MTVQVAALIETKYMENVLTTQYTSAANTRTIVDKLVLKNSISASFYAAVHLVPSGGTADASNLIVNRVLVANESYTCPEITGQTLEPGDFIATRAAFASSIILRASGRLIT